MLLSTEERRWIAFEERIMKLKPRVKPNTIKWWLVHEVCDAILAASLPTNLLHCQSTLTHAAHRFSLTSDVTS